MKITLDNVGIVNHCDVEFVPGLNLIIGQSGSGKSTLMRSIHNIATNEFSDSDISFGKNTMNIEINLGDDSVSYTRHVKSKGDKFYYTVNGNKYAKVGRSAVQQAADILKIGNLDINGEDINFNFNLQFSTPFLIFGSQSTLYNVLTYRSTFDVSSMNDYYNTDVKSNANDIATNEKVKDHLEHDLEQLESQEKEFAPIEKLYSDLIAYKHKYSMLEELNRYASDKNTAINIANKTQQIKCITDRIESISNTIKCLLDLNVILNSIKNQINITALQCDVISLIEKNSAAIGLISTIIELNKLNIKTKEHFNINKKVRALNKCISNSILGKINADFIDNLAKQNKRLLLKSKFNSIIDVLSNIQNVNMSNIDSLIELHRKYNEHKSISDKCIKLSEKELPIKAELAKFKVCPLCGNQLCDSCL